MSRSARLQESLNYDADAALWEEEAPLSTQAALEVVRAYEMSLSHGHVASSEDRDREAVRGGSGSGSAAGRPISIADRIAQAGNKAKFTNGMPAAADSAGGSGSSSTHFPFSSSPSPTLKSPGFTSSGSLKSLGSSDDLARAASKDTMAAPKETQQQQPLMPSAKLNIVVLHLDLGIGGAERLMVNAAMCLQSLGHHVTVATTHHDPRHCFEETKPWVSERERGQEQGLGQGQAASPQRGGVLGNRIVVYGDWLPRRLPLVGATALCSAVRMLYLACVLLVLHLCSFWRFPFSGASVSALLQADDEEPASSPRSGAGAGPSEAEAAGGDRLSYFVPAPGASSGGGVSSPSPRPSGQQRSSPGPPACSPRTGLADGGATSPAPAPPRSPDHRIDVVVLDGISLPLPLFSWLGVPSIFYCHFPDKLLVQYNNNKDVMTDVNERLKRGETGFVMPPLAPGAGNGDEYRMRRWYRSMLDALEEVCMGCANVIMVNSKFTEAVFRASFALLGKDVQPLVVYPTLDPPTVRQDVPDAAREEAGAAEAVSYLHALVKSNHKFEPPQSYTRTHVYVSLNRYERKKKVELALDALHHLAALYKQDKAAATKYPKSPSSSAAAAAHDRFLVVIAGGYDDAVDENIEYLLFLKSRCDQLGLRYVDERWKAGDAVTTEGPVSVVFRVSISSAERTALLAQAAALLYTPDNEHFGIVPLECMQRGAPVVAVNSGGPRETVVHKSTGFLCDQSAESFASAMLQLAQMDNATGPEGTDDGNGGRIVRSPLSLQMGASGKHHVEQHFHSNVMRRQFHLCLQQLFPERVFSMDSEMGSKYGRAKGRSRYIGTSGARVRTSSNDEAPATFVPFDDGSLEGKGKDKNQGKALQEAGQKGQDSWKPAAAANHSDPAAAAAAAAAGAAAKQKALSPEARFLLDALHRTRPKKDKGDGFDTDYGNEKSNMELLMPGRTPFDNQVSTYNASFVGMVAERRGAGAGAGAGNTAASSPSQSSKRVYTNSSAITSSWQAQKALVPLAVTIETGVGINQQTDKYSNLIAKTVVHWVMCGCIVVVVPVAVICYAP